MIYFLRMLSFVILILIFFLLTICLSRAKKPYFPSLFLAILCLGSAHLEFRKTLFYTLSFLMEMTNVCYGIGDFLNLNGLLSHMNKTVSLGDRSIHIINFGTMCLLPGLFYLLKIISQKFFLNPTVVLEKWVVVGNFFLSGFEVLLSLIPINKIPDRVLVLCLTCGLLTCSSGTLLIYMEWFQESTYRIAPTILISHLISVTIAVMLIKTVFDATENFNNVFFNTKLSIRPFILSAAIVTIVYFSVRLIGSNMFQSAQMLKNPIKEFEFIHYHLRSFLSGEYVTLTDLKTQNLSLLSTFQILIVASVCCFFNVFSILFSILYLALFHKKVPSLIKNYLLSFIIAILSKVITGGILFILIENYKI